MGEILQDGPRKPMFGDPCNGCGLCCVATACAIGVEFISTAKAGRPCPALEWEGGRSWCGLVRHPTRYMDRPAKDIAEIREQAGRLGADMADLDKVFGLLVAQDLGGVGGRCDAGPPGGHGHDDDAGHTAAEWVERAHV